MKVRFAIIGSFLFSILMGSSQVFADTWVVTSLENKQKLEIADVKQIFKGDVQKWESGKSIVLVVPDVGSPEGGIMLEKIFEMSPKDYKKFWMQKVFKGEAANPPESKSGDSMKQFLKAYPDAIGVMAGADASVRKIVKLD